MAVDRTVNLTVPSRAPSLRLVCVCPSNVWVSILYIVAAGFHTRVDAIGAMKQVVAEVTPPSLDEDGCQIYHWSQGADDPTLFLLYMEWRDKACFEAHIATPHVKHAEDRLKREKMLIEPAKEWHFCPL